MGPIVRPVDEIRLTRGSGARSLFFHSDRAGIIEEIPQESDANESQTELSLSQSKARYVGTKAFRGERVPFRAAKANSFSYLRKSATVGAELVQRADKTLSVNCSRRMVSLNNLTQFLALTRFIMPR